MASPSSHVRIAVPVSGKMFCEHFGRCDGFYLCDVVEGVVDRPRIVRRPRGKCESVPHWLRDLGVNVVLAGGIGMVGTRRLTELGIEVATGHAGTDPQAIATEFVRGVSGNQDNLCARFEHRHRHCKEPKTTARR